VFHRASASRSFVGGLVESDIAGESKKRSGVQMNPIIVTTDGSDHSLRVLPHADRLARALRAELEVVRVVEPSEIAAEPGEDSDAAAERTCARLREEAAEAMRRSGIDGTASCIVGGEEKGVGDTLLEHTAAASVVAMHSRGRSGLGRLLHGSVALDVLKAIDQPVLLGGPELLAPPTGDGYRLMITTDLSPDSEQCLRALAPLLEATDVEVTLLFVHFHAPQGIDNEAERAKNEAALTAKRALLPASTSVDVRVREIPIGGGVDTAIMEVADEAGCHAIAMSTHGASARHHVLMGSVAMSVLGRSHLPVLVVRAKG
jgi:nucleotide-binding universal stress UspA family protein